MNPGEEFSFGHIKKNLNIRIMDVLITIPLLLISLPVMAGISAFIFIFDGWPVLFRQNRPGLGMKEIAVLKFRTMRVGAEKFEEQKIKLVQEPNIQTENDERVTAFGAILRRLSLDELPQLFSVLRGQMSLVGPRPLIKAEVEMFPYQYLARYRVLPGITGLAQVAGRSTISVWDILELDLQWVENYSLALYIKILWRTFFSLFRIREAF